MRFIGGKTGFTGKNLFRFIAGLILLTSSAATSQIPVNGLCKYTGIRVDEGGAFFQSINFNGDAYTDQVIYHPAKKAVSLYAGAAEGQFKRTRLQKTGIALTAITPLRDNRGRTRSYAFISRNERKIQIGEFNAYGNFRVSSSLQLQGYPETVSAADLDNDGKPELIISGPSFPGIKVVDSEKGKKSFVIDEKKPYPVNAVFDIDFDGLPDLAAYSPWEGKIQIFYNDYRGGLRLVRGVVVPGPVSNMIVFDINLDGFQDILYASRNSIQILYGDSVASYSKKGAIKTGRNVDKFIVGDYNRDGTIDIAYLNIKASVVNVILSDQQGSIYPEVEYITAPGLTDLASFYSRYVTGISALSSAGEIHTITKLLLFQSGDKITFGGNAVDFTSQDLNKDGITDFIITDSSANHLKVIIRNKEGYPSGMLYVEPKIKFNRFRYSLESPDALNFIFYYTGGNTFEYRRVLVNGGQIREQWINGYTKGEIRAISFPQVTAAGYIFSAASSKGRNTFIEKFDYTKGKLFSTFSSKTDLLYELLDFLTPDSLYYWFRDGQTLIFSRSSLKNLRVKKPLESFPIGIKEGRLLTSRELVNFSLQESANFSVFRSGNEAFAVLFRKNKFQVFRDDLMNNIPDESLMKTAYFDQRREGIIRPVFFDGRNGKVYNTGFLLRRNRILLNPIAEIPGANRFYPVNLYPNKNFILYTKPDERVFSLIRI